MITIHRGSSPIFEPNSGPTPTLPQGEGGENAKKPRIKKPGVFTRGYKYFTLSGLRSKNRRFLNFPSLVKEGWLKAGVIRKGLQTSFFVICNFFGHWFLCFGISRATRRDCPYILLLTPKFCPLSFVPCPPSPYPILNELNCGNSTRSVNMAR